MEFIPNPAGIAAIGKSPGMELALRSKAGDVANMARAIAPVETGAYRDSIVASSEPGEGRVTADIRYAVYVEMGTSTHAPHATLRRALESA